MGTARGGDGERAPLLNRSPGSSPLPSPRAPCKGEGFVAVKGGSTSPDNECNMEGRSGAEWSSEGSPWDKLGMLDWESALKTGAGGRAI